MPAQVSCFASYTAQALSSFLCTRKIKLRACSEDLQRAERVPSRIVCYCSSSLHRPRKVCLFFTSAVVPHAALIWLWHYGASFPGESSFGREAALALARFLSPRKCVRADSGVSRAVHAIQHRPTTVGQVIAHIRRVAFTAKNQFFEFGASVLTASFTFTQQ